MKCFLIIISLIFGGCGGGSSSDNASSNSTSNNTTQTGETLAPPTVIPPGSKISVNPEITFNTELSTSNSGSASYINSAGTDFWIGSADIDITLQKKSSTLVLSFTLPNEDFVEFILSDFTDTENDGFFDECRVEARVNNITKVITKTNFSGTNKPRNIESSSSPTINRAPTDDEFRKYLVGQILYSRDQDGSGGLYRFGDNEMTQYDSSGNAVITANYQYSYNGGDPRLIFEFPESDSELSNARLVYKLEFDTIYEGSFVSLPESTVGGENISLADTAYGAFTFLKFLPSE